VLLAVIPAFGLIAHGVNHARETAYIEAQEDTLDLVRGIAEEQRDIVRHAQVLLQSLAHAHELVDSGAAEACRRLLANLCKSACKTDQVGGVIGVQN
jgi:hypothetical protein